jgi:hypothetical protein
MRIPFRQGVFIFQQDSSLTPIHIRKNPDLMYLDVGVFPKSTIGSIADGSSNYLFSEVISISKAWGPFSPGVTQYFYWDIDKLTGELTRGITNFEPIYSPAAPLNPQLDQHWFDKTTSKMKVWAGTKWQDKLRLFAGIYQSSGSLTLYVNSSTAGPNYASEANAGYILRDYDGRPIRLATGEFLTTDTDIKVSAYLSQAVTKPSPQFLDVSAAEYIPRFSIVALSMPNKVVLASSNPSDYKKPVGIVTVDLIPGEVTSMIFEGVITNPLWAFPNSALGEPLFCDPTGQLTLSRPITDISFRVGTVLGTNVIRVLIEDDLTGLVQRTATHVVKYLDDLLDVTATTSPIDQQVLAFFTASNQWQPLTLTIPKTEYLDDLLDVTATTSALDQQVLTFSSLTGQWQPASVPRVEYLEQLLDVTATTSPLDEQVLAFSTLSNQWQPASIPKVEYLDQLLDVTATTSALDEQVLAFSTATGQWQPLTLTIPPAVEYLEQLLDVTATTSPLDEQVLAFSTATGQWQPASIPKVEYLEQLLDVTATTSPLDEQVLAFSTATGQWQPASIPKVEYLEQLLDVTATTSPLDEQVLAFSTATGQWQPASIPKVEYLNDLLDVTATTTPLDQQVLAFSTATGQWQPLTLDIPPAIEYLDDLLDVSVNSETLEPGAGLIYDGESWTNKNIDFYDIACFIEDKPTTSTTLLSFVAPRNFEFLPNFDNSQAISQVASTVIYTLTIKKNLETIGYVTFQAGSSIGDVYLDTESIASEPLRFNFGDILTVHSPIFQDSTLKDIAITLIAKVLL